MRESPVRFASGAQPLAGTLCLPEGEGPFAAAVLLSGSGPLDRDSDHPRLRFGVSRQVAHALADAGFASLRYDKRGVGESPGDWRAAGLFDNVDDAGAAFDTLAARPEVDARRVYVVGHSEGAVLATALAGRGVPTAGLVLLSGSARSGEQVLLWQAARIAPTLPAPVRAVLRLTRTDLVAKVARNHARVKATTTDVARIGGARINARWTREFMAYDPSRDLPALRCPVLAITGGKDLQVDPGDLDRIARLVPGPVDTWLAPDVSHALRVQPGPASLRAYRKEVQRPVEPTILARITDWMARAQVVQRPDAKG
jgi:uncharacterized protein